NSDALSDNVWVGVKIASPNFVTEDSDLFRPRFVVLSGEIPAKHRRDTDNLEKIFGHVTAGITLRIVLVSDIDRRSIEIAGHGRERFLRRLQVLVILSGGNIADTEIVVLIAGLGIDQTDAH